jgi:hypothetical protein
MNPAIADRAATRAILVCVGIAYARSIALSLVVRLTGGHGGVALVAAGSLLLAFGLRTEPLAGGSSPGRSIPV